MYNRNIHHYVIACLIISTFLLSDPAHAQVFSSAENVGQAIAGFLTGAFARIIGVIAFAGFGIATAMGRVDWKWGAAIMIGLVAIFVGATIVAEMEGLV